MSDEAQTEHSYIHFDILQNFDFAMLGLVPCWNKNQNVPILKATKNWTLVIVLLECQEFPKENLKVFFVTPSL